MTNHKMISDALAICMPETRAESELDCTDCPFFETCSANLHTISLPSVLMIAIRNYFSKNFQDKPIQ